MSYSRISRSYITWLALGCGEVQLVFLVCASWLLSSGVGYFFDLHRLWRKRGSLLGLKIADLESDSKGFFQGEQLSFIIFSWVCRSCIDHFLDFITLEYLSISSFLRSTLLSSLLFLLSFVYLFYFVPSYLPQLLFFSILHLIIQ